MYGGIFVTQNKLAIHVGNGCAYSVWDSISRSITSSLNYMIDNIHFSSAVLCVMS
jgi:hypothetical protein